MSQHNLLLVTLQSFTSLIVIIWEDWKVKRLYMGAALIANKQPIEEQIKSEPNAVAIKQSDVLSLQNPVFL